MTRERLFEITDALCLALDVERVTTGPVDGPAFRCFEFIHPHESHLQRAAESIRDEWGASRDFCGVRISEIDFRPYLEVSSFYCGPGAPKK